MKYVALLRGVNVGGKNKLPMQDLVELFEEAGCADVETYIQSGNVVFRAAASAAKRLPAKLSEAIARRHGYSVPVVLRSARELEKVVGGNPFLMASAAEKELHVYFLSAAPTAAAIKKLDAGLSTPDEFAVRGAEIYLRLPNGMARTKLTNAYFDSKLSVVCTARNWATVLRLAELANRPSES